MPVKKLFSQPVSAPISADMTARPRIPSDLLPLRDCEADGALFFMPARPATPAQRAA